MEAILGYLIALMLSMLSLAGFATWAKAGVTNVQTAAAASQMLVFDKAALQFVQDEAATLVAQATASVPVSVTPAMLVNGGYLPAGFSVTNVFGQTWLLQVMQPTPNNLQALVTSQGGRAITDTRQLVQIAAQAGAQGGFVPYAGQNGDPTMVPTRAYGAYGAWQVPLANYTNPGSGRLASLLAFTGAQANNGYLYRVQVPGHPELNQMQTSLDLGGNDVNNARRVSANTSLTSNGETYLTSTGSPGSACGVDKSIRTSTTGTGLVICFGGIWQPIGTAVTNVTDGTWCGNNGQLATSGTNVGYICKGNRYVALTNGLGNLSITRKFENVSDGMTFSKDNCPGGTAWAMYTPRQEMVNITGTVMPPIQGTYFSVNDYGTYWYAQASAMSPAAWYSGNDTGALGGQLLGTVTTGCMY
ncbi:MULTISPECIES: shufflon system plasmid conjugative transfer pilus tip adhesin PilV [Cupriavidus]|uniref:Shufflon system plasmid conjugative transfer pilus tip adhesin PilV n=1 Tax=Cupriavidus basilensis TaxID=68895 RepID=A0A643FSA1_9BURK|nr:MULTISPECIES: shufflon system plasmid conjugative transfer pilus tip adhesin PilV [Cupriavidus]KUE86419.1 pilus assembly protein PilV [Cupriavidus necator]NOV23622.1 shufflon system plasmid conjugative transfer pilus tip adhesin PilV [Cupriavidus necator]QOT81692.1 shufflon system plasmid conjugative transfer pilus tip adhesin PilV [Cupriavidus basilensis]BDB30092.1 shufflon system plasmid conjugative transfer pilus tip adhesin PilV [Cupriavidus sp. P-10]